MKITFAERGWEDYLYWQGESVDVLRRINDLLEECRRTPFRGTGRPEPLKANYAGFWSRRITDEHRLVYRLNGMGGDQALTIAQCRYHYSRQGNRKR